MERSADKLRDAPPLPAPSGEAARPATELAGYVRRVLGPGAPARVVSAALGELGPLGRDHPLDGADARRAREVALRAVARERSGLASRLARLGRLRFGCGRVPGLLAARAAGEIASGEVTRLYRHLDDCADCAELTSRFDAAEWQLQHHEAGLSPPAAGDPGPVARPRRTGRPAAPGEPRPSRPGRAAAGAPGPDAPRAPAEPRPSRPGRGGARPPGGPDAPRAPAPPAWPLVHPDREPARPAANGRGAAERVGRPDEAPARANGAPGSTPASAGPRPAGSPRPARGRPAAPVLAGPAPRRQARATSLPRTPPAFARRGGPRARPAGRRVAAAVAGLALLGAGTAAALFGSSSNRGHPAARAPVVVPALAPASRTVAAAPKPTPAPAPKPKAPKPKAIKRPRARAKPAVRRRATGPAVVAPAVRRPTAATSPTARTPAPVTRAPVSTPAPAPAPAPAPRPVVAPRPQPVAPARPAPVRSPTPSAPATVTLPLPSNPPPPPPPPAPGTTTITIPH